MLVAFWLKNKFLRTRWIKTGIVQKALTKEYEFIFNYLIICKKAPLFCQKRKDTIVHYCPACSKVDLKINQQSINLISAFIKCIFFFTTNIKSQKCIMRRTISIVNYITTAREIVSLVDQQFLCKSFAQ